jgi:hypothetical protein
MEAWQKNTGSTRSIPLVVEPDVGAIDELGFRG